MKKVLFTLVGTLLLASLVGCGEQPTQTTTQSPTGTQPTSTVIDEGDVQRDENGNIIYNNVNLVMWSVTTGDDAGTQDEIISEFNEMYKGMIHVEATHTSRYDLESILNTTMQFDRENAPDLLFNHGMRAAEYVERGWLEPTNKYFQISQTPFDKSDFVPSLLETLELDGQNYGMPIDCHSAVMEIRKDILEKNNLPIPTNYRELVQVCDTAAKKAANNELWIRGETSDGTSASEWRLATTAEEYNAFPISFGDMWVHEFVSYTAAVQNGGTLVDEKGMPSWNTTETANGLQVLRNWLFPDLDDNSVNEYALSKYFGSSYDVGDTPFASGNAIFKLQGPWAYQRDLSEFDRILKLDGGSANITTRSLSNMFALDTTKDYASKIKGEGHAIMMTSTINSSYTKACAATVFMDYMANYSGIRWAKRGHIPAAISVSNSNEYLQDPAYEEYVKYWGMPEDFVVYPATKYLTTIDTYYKGAVQQVMSASDVGKEITEILNKEYNDCLAYIELYSD